MKAIIFITVLSIFSSRAFCENHTIELGWADYADCSRVVSSGKNIFGLPDTVQTAKQRVYAYAIINAKNANDIRDDLKECAIEAAAGATLSSIFASPGAATPTFNAYFSDCMSRKSKDFISIKLDVRGVCMWPKKGNGCKNIELNESGKSHFRPGDKWKTCSGYEFSFESNGNLIHKNPQGNIIWQSGTQDTGANKLSIQTDGNLVIYRANNKEHTAVWASNTQSSESVFLTIQEDGNVVLYKRPGGAKNAIWKTDTMNK